MHDPLEILRNYWGFTGFRDKQGAIIESILQKKETLALLPTGGGKSICYQVPGLAMDGICLVISPLIALMEDQVESLKAKGIKAVAITSAMHKRQIDIALDNAIYGDTKFLYVSPERLKTQLFKARFEKMNINLIAVDEAHCISQWGYDFRPSYLEISELRKIKPKVPFLALTATATLDVVTDIQEQLLFKQEHVIRKSFERKNLSYNTLHTNNKFNRVEAFLKQNNGSGIIYCTTRRGVKELYLRLHHLGFEVDYYHAGLSFEERKTKQTAWMKNQTQVIIATNAFGMGIDKADVRFVLHYDLPATLEAYFQEAGRGGRDEKEAKALLFFETEDINKLKDSVTLKYPPITTIKKIYNALGNHFQLAIGSGKDEFFPLDIAAFSDKYNQNLIGVYNALKFLERCGFIQLSENYKQPSRLKILGTNHELYAYQVKDEKLNQIIQFILRTEMGAFDEYTTINLHKIAQKTGLTIRFIHEKLLYLTQLELVDYLPKSELPTLTYLTERLADNNLSISPKFYNDRKKIAFNKLEAMLNFVSEKTCKSELLLHYFGETNTEPCGVCNSCLDTRKNDPVHLETLLLDAAKKLSLRNKTVQVIDLITSQPQIPEQAILETLRTLVDNKLIVMGNKGRAFQLK